MILVYYFIDYTVYRHTYIHIISSRQYCITYWNHSRFDFGINGNKMGCSRFNLRCIAHTYTAQYIHT